MFVRQRAGAVSLIGPREVNEDSYALRDLSLDNAGTLAVLAVADGMGGLRGGDIASRTAIDVVLGSALDALDGQDLPASFSYVNDEIRRIAAATGTAGAMGTTLTVAVVRRGEATVCHVGDSRAYVLHAGQLTQVTEDHSRVGRLLREGVLTDEQAMHHPEQNVLERALGAGDDSTADSYRLGLGPGDVLFLCSDGLHTFVAAQEIQAELSTNPSVQDACDRLAGLAEQRGSQDNITAVAWQYPDLDDGALSPAEAALAPATRVRRRAEPSLIDPQNRGRDDLVNLALRAAAVYAGAFVLGFLLSRIV